MPTSIAVTAVVITSNSTVCYKEGITLSSDIEACSYIHRVNSMHKGHCYKLVYKILTIRLVIIDNNPVDVELLS